MTNPFVVEHAAHVRRHRYRQDADTWRLLKPVRQERARSLRRAVRLWMGRLVPGRSAAPETPHWPAAVTE